MGLKQLCFTLILKDLKVLGSPLHMMTGNFLRCSHLLFFQSLSNIFLASGHDRIFALATVLSSMLIYNLPETVCSLLNSLCVCAPPSLKWFKYFARIHVYAFCYAFGVVPKLEITLGGLFSLCPFPEIISCIAHG